MEAPVLTYVGEITYVFFVYFFYLTDLTSRALEDQLVEKHCTKQITDCLIQIVSHLLEESCQHWQV